MANPSKLNIRLAVRQMLENRIRSRARIQAMQEMARRHHDEYMVLYQQYKIELMEQAIAELEGKDFEDSVDDLP